MARCDSLLLALDFVLLGSILLIRSFAQLGSAVPVLDFPTSGLIVVFKKPHSLGPCSVDPWLVPFGLGILAIGHRLYTLGTALVCKELSLSWVCYICA